MGRIIKKHVSDGISISDINDAKNAIDSSTASDQANSSLTALKDWFNKHGIKRGGIPVTGNEVSLDYFDNSGTAYILMRAKNETDTRYDNDTYASMEFTYPVSNSTGGWFLEMDRGAVGATQSPSASPNPYFNVIKGASSTSKIIMTGLGGNQKDEVSTQYSCRLYDADPAWSDPKSSAPDPVVSWNNDSYPYASSMGNGAQGLLFGVQTGKGVATMSKNIAVWFKNTRIPGTHTGNALSTASYAIFHENTDSGNADHDYEAFTWPTTNRTSKWSHYIRADFPAPGSYGRTTLESWSGNLGTGGES